MKVTLRDKREITIDIYALSVTEVRSLAEKKSKDNEGDEILGKAIGMKVKEIQALSYPDYLKITRAFWKCIRNPFMDEDDNEKNSPSESTSA